MTKTVKKYNKLVCGCKYGIDNYEDNVFCKKHKSYKEIKLLIGADLRRIVIGLANTL